jgi:hypothetical protein
MGTVKLCVFAHAVLRLMMVLGLYPPAHSKPVCGHDNDTSRAMGMQFGGYRFIWNDLVPYAPERNANVKQTILRTSSDDGLLSDLVADCYRRMLVFIDSEQSKGRTPLVMVAGGTANAAFRMFPLQDPAQPAFSVACFKIVHYQCFTALIDVPHPSAHLMTGGYPPRTALLNDSMSVARALLSNPRSTPVDVLRHVSESTQKCHAANAQAIATLELPGCVGSWFMTTSCT